ncbi:hypothetical protein E2C01_014926 [Portunus trituberculatus]|uniref:Uncharacterized protein n=1 Tax=Portunus trituberculatus TaxID=210409 RepID=A0A5B7DLF5_PORTR|nr:hypothetical protein [Portunus trituberculatus]
MGKTGWVTSRRPSHRTTVHHTTTTTTTITHYNTTQKTTPDYHTRYPGHPKHCSPAPALTFSILGTLPALLRSVPLLPLLLCLPPGSILQQLCVHLIHRQLYITHHRSTDETIFYGQLELREKKDEKIIHAKQ